MHAAANSAAVAAASGGNLADYLWSPQPSSVSGGSMIPHPLSLQHLRPPTHAPSLMSHFASSNNAAQLQTSPHLPFPTNPFFWPKRAFETPADSLLGIFGINILHVVPHKKGALNHWIWVISNWISTLFRRICKRCSSSWGTEYQQTSRHMPF